MRFLSPIWLTALIPWGVLALWLLRRQSRPATVSFVGLWPVEGDVRRHRRGWKRPPWMILLLLTAILLAIAGATGPVLPTETARQPPITILIDRGLTMSVDEPAPRYALLAGHLQPLLASRLGMDQRVDLQFIPYHSVIQTTLGRWLGRLDAVAPTGVDTAPLLEREVASLLARTTGSIFVISDKMPTASDGRLIAVTPQEALNVVGIARLGARDGSHPQVMVKIRNQSSLREARLIIRTRGRTYQRTVDLPQPPGVRDFFVDVDELGRAVEAEIISQADPWPGNRAWLVRSGRPVRVVADSIFSGPLARMIEVYNRAQPPSDHPREIRVVTAQIAEIDQPAVIVSRQEIPVAASDGRPSITLGPLTDHIRWDDLPVAGGSHPPTGEWRTVVAMGGYPILAVRAQSPRQVWVGFDTSAWSDRPDYVILWKNIFDYLGGDEVVYQSSRTEQLSGDWKRVPPAVAGDGGAGLLPGLYQRGDGQLRAVNALDVVGPPVIDADWRKAMQRVRPVVTGGMELHRMLYAAALACVAAAMSGFWKYRRRPHHVINDSLIR